MSATISKVMWPFLILLITDNAWRTSADVYTSTNKMKRMVYLETQMISHFEEYVLELYHEVANKMSKITPDQYGALKYFCEQAKFQNDLARRNFKWMENPINVFHTLKRLVRDWTNLIYLLRQHEKWAMDSSETFTSFADLIILKSYYPNEEDLIGASVAIWRLLSVYKLDINDLAKGRIHSTQTYPLTAEDFSIMGDNNYEKFDYFSAIKFYNMSMVLMKRPGYRMTDNILYNLTKNDIYRTSKETAHIKYINALKEFEDTEELDLAIQDAANLYPHNYYVKKMQVNRLLGQNNRLCVSSIYAPEDLSKLDIRYREICGKDLKTDKELSELSCVYWPGRLYLVKAKAEYLNHNPDVILFHDFLSTTEVEDIKSAAYHILHRSTVMGLQGGMYSDTRISQTGWLHNADKVRRVSDRIKFVTGLQTRNSSEPYQVLNYGLGGMYEPHTDYLPEYQANEDSLGNRVATMILMLSDVQYGGATVFPKLKTRAPIKRGNALFWFNIRRSGKPVPETLHAGCPILIGSKWIVNKWIRETKQIYRRPCSLDQSQ